MKKEDFEDPLRNFSDDISPEQPVYDSDLRRYIELHKEVYVNGKNIKFDIKGDLLQHCKLTEEDYTVIPNTLYETVENCGLSAVKFNIEERGIPYNERSETKDGQTPLHVAAKLKKFEIFKYLLQHGADLMQKDFNGRIPLHEAAKSGCLDIVKYYQQHNISLQSHQDYNNRNTPLHEAAMHGHLEIVKYIVNSYEKHDIRLDVENKDGNTALQLATVSAKNGIVKLQIVKFLYFNGASINTKNKHGKETIQMAVDDGTIDLFKFIHQKIETNQHWSVYFINRVQEVGFSRLLDKKVDKAKRIRKMDNVCEFLKIVLVYSCRCDNYSFVSELCSLILDRESFAMQIFVAEGTYQQAVADIIHFRDNQNRRAYHYAKHNNKLATGLDLLQLEKVAHGVDNFKDALLCIRHADVKHPHDLWLTEAYQIINPPRRSKITTYLAVTITLIPSIILVYFDLYTDIISCINYGYIAFYNSAEIEQECLNQLQNKSCLVYGNYSCYDTYDKLSYASRIYTNGTCDESNYWTPCIKRSAETIGLQYLTAFVIMLIICILSCLSYFGIAFNMKSYHHPGPSCNLRNPLFTRMLWFLSKLFWPLTYVREVCKYRFDPKFDKALQESKESWKLLKNIENGFENYYQILLQLYLLSPYLKSLSRLPLRELVNWENFISTFSVPDVFCSQQNVQAALGKLLLSTISLSFGLSSRQSTKEGESFGQSVKNVVLAVSYFFLCYARIMSILPLFSLENPFIALLVFSSVHSLMNLFILRFTIKLELLFNLNEDYELINNVLNENFDSGVEESVQSENNTNECHVVRLSAPNNGENVNSEDEINDCNQSLRNLFLRCKVKMKSLLCSKKNKIAMSYLASCLASHTFIITFHAKSSYRSLVKQTLFQCLIVIENLVLLLLPAMLPILYPNKNCYNFDLKEVRYACLMWLIGIVLQVLYYKCLHPMAAGNGPALEDCQQFFRRICYGLKSTFCCRKEQRHYSPVPVNETAEPNQENGDMVLQPISQRTSSNGQILAGILPRKIYHHESKTYKASLLDDIINMVLIIFFCLVRKTDIVWFEDKISTKEDSDIDVSGFIYTEPHRIDHHTVWFQQGLRDENAAEVLEYSRALYSLEYMEEVLQKYLQMMPV